MAGARVGGYTYSETQLYFLEKHIHGQGYVIPELAAPITLTAAGSAYTYGNAVEIIPANTLTNHLNLFDIHYLVVSDISNTGSYTIQLIQDGTVVGTVGVVRSSNFSQEGYIPVQVPKLDATKNVTAKLASSQAGATLKVKSWIHGY